MLTAPLIVLLYDRVFLSRSWRELLRLRWGLYAALFATLLLYPLMLAQAPAEWKESAGFAYAGAAPLQPIGIFQINVKIPATLSRGSAAVSVSISGIATTKTVTVAVR